MPGWLDTFGPTVTITPGSWESLGVGYLGSSAWSAAVWPAANRVVLIPFRVYRPFAIQRAFWYNGATVAGNVEVAVYDEEFNRLVTTGSTVMAGASVIQSAAIASTELVAGLYYLAMISDSATATFFRRGLASATCRAGGMLQVTTGAIPLAATLTPVTVSSAHCPMCGVSQRSFI